MITSSPTRPERAIHTSADDKLERSQFIERLTAAILSPTTGRAAGVVIGITGPWGSGKTSVLNLLSEHIKKKHQDALVVRFDPWLVSGRNDLIAEFLGELIGTINADKKRFKEFKKLGNTLAEYGAQLAPVSNLWLPGIGAIVSGGLSVMANALSKKESLNTLRAELVKELERISAPIIVLIDEIDRVEDDEIRTVAQLVRSVADFPGISYVLAYDPERVVQALGAGASAKNSDARGRAYLEKIVQLQIPLPVIFDNEVSRLLTADLYDLKTKLQLPENFETIMRFEELMEILNGHVINTLRDIRRLVDTFHVLRGMLLGEVDWIDLLAYSALMTKSPGTIDLVRREPEDYLDSAMSARGAERRLRLQKIPVEDRINGLVQSSEQNDGTTKLLRFIFPSLSGRSRRDYGHADALCERRPLLTTLRLGLLPGAFSREKMHELVNGSPDQVEGRLREFYESGALGQFTDRLDDIYFELGTIDHISFWQGVAGFMKKPDCVWMASYSPMHEVARNLATILEHAVGKNEELREDAVSVFRHLRDAGESELTAYWLRAHVHLFGLFGHDKLGSDEWFLDEEQIDALAREMAQTWRKEHLSGELIPCRWDLQPVYTMIDTQVWDEECRQALDDVLQDDRALDGISLMLYGGHFSTDSSTVEKMFDYECYTKRVKSRLASETAGELHETVRTALNSALKGGW